jgi:hypothetical protein
MADLRHDLLAEVRRRGQANISNIGVSGETVEFGPQIAGLAAGQPGILVLHIAEDGEASRGNGQLTDHIALLGAGGTQRQLHFQPRNIAGQQQQPFRFAFVERVERLDLRDAAAQDALIGAGRTPHADLDDARGHDLQFQRAAGNFLRRDLDRGDPAGTAQRRIGTVADRAHFAQRPFAIGHRHPGERAGDFRLHCAAIGPREVQPGDRQL